MKATLRPFDPLIILSWLGLQPKNGSSVGSLVAGFSHQPVYLGNMPHIMAVRD
jgi:hypothetical protein